RPISPRLRRNLCPGTSHPALRQSPALRRAGTADVAPVSVRVPAGNSSAQFASDVQYYLALQPRQLPSRYLYDALGSALFEAICRLPWYGITRAELRLLNDHGPAIFTRVAPLSTIVELGGGSGEKLARLVEAGRRAWPAPQRVDLHLVDVSRSALGISSR